jgi:hypothetical protein
MDTKPGSPGRFLKESETMKRPLTISIFTALVLCATFPAMSLAANGQQSDNNLRYARARVERDIDMLQRDQHDYDGYRVKAIDSLQDARHQLQVALAYDRDHEYIAPAAAPMLGEGYGANRSDRNLAYVRQDVEQVIDMLQRDNTDYGGHRIDAIGFLQRSREQLSDALAYDRGHE